MWPFPKVIKRWQEPKGFCETRAAVAAQAARWWSKPLAAMLVACFLLTEWSLAMLDPNKEPPPLWVVLPGSLAFGFFLVCLPGWLERRGETPTVSLFEHGIHWVFVGHPREWRFKEIAAFAIHDCCEFRILALTKNSGKEWLIGVPLEIEPKELETLLSARGLTQICLESENERSL